MKTKRFAKVIAFATAVIMLIGAMPMSVFAAQANFVSETHDVYSSITSTIAPGVQQSINYAYAKDGKQMVYYVATADINRDDVDVYANYKDNQCAVFGMSKLREQIAAAQERNTTDTTAPNYNPYYTVVAGVNGDFYNMTTGKPTGAFVMEGTVVNASNNRPFFAILKNGKAVIGANTADWNTYTAESPVMEAIGGSFVLVKDGKDVTANASGSYNTDRHSRTCVGVTEDGKVVMMSLDGRQEPFSCGGTMHELAQIMLEAGCVAAINLDGGGSTTFVARQEGETEVSVINRPSDGSERAISSSLMIVSTTPPSDVFDRATLMAENSYVTPGSTVDIKVTGISPAGTAAEVPAEAVLTVKDSSLGEIKDGKFVSNGTAGDAVIQLVYGGKVVGETTIYVVIPEKLEFSNAAITVPYGKSETLKVSATYGLNTVVLNENDIVYELKDSEAGTIEGNVFTACDASVALTESVITAKYAGDAGISCSVNLVLGKASVVFADFEDGTTNGFTFSAAINDYQDTRMYNVTPETGKVHSGNGALALEMDYRHTDAPVPSAYLGENFMNKKIALEPGVKKIGAWIYLPEQEEMIAATYRFYAKGVQTGKTANLYFINNGDSTLWEDTGWHYFELDLSGIGENTTLMFALQIYLNVSQGDQSSAYYIDDYNSINSKYTLYIDDITLDYSTAVEDRENPVFEYVRTTYGSLNNAEDLVGQTVTENVVSFTARATDDTTKTNASGLNIKTAKAYIDGIEITKGFSCSDIGMMTIDDIKLADGAHTVKFEICDNKGNMSSITRQIVIDAESEMTNVSIVPKDSTLDKIAIGSVYWMNVETSAIEDINKVTVELNLNSVNTWELDHMVVAEGFEAEYVIDDVTNNAVITFTRTGESSLTGKAVIAELPIRTWESLLYTKDATYTPEYMWTKKMVFPIDIQLRANLGAIEFADGTSGSFSMKPFAVETELYSICENMPEYSSKTRWHEHTVIALEDKPATCTESGYTGRTYCEGCNSVVEWGTTVDSNGHTYEMTDGVLKCECGKLFNGVHTDGYTYVDGLLSAGWIGDSYYVDGVAVKGIQLVDGYYYNFGDDGVSQGRYTGLFFDGEVYRYSQLGELSAGWKLIDGDWYYFRESTKAAPQPGYVYWDGTPYKFEETGKLISGVWVTTDAGTRYYYAGSSYYRTVNTATVAFYEIDGNIYGFDRNGYIYKDGVYGLGESNQKDLVYYEFDENGVRTGIIDFYNYSGIIKTISGNMHYYVNGTPKQMGLIKIGDYFYYIRSGGVVATGSYNCTYNMTDEIPIGVYEFDANGRMLNVPEVKPDEPEVPEIKNGIVNENGTLYYYIDGEKQVNLGLIQIVDNGEPCYIYVRTAGQLAVGKYKVWINNDIVPYASEQDFGTDGKMKNAPVPEVKDGIVNENGTLYYYIDGEKQVNLGLIQIVDNGEPCYIYVRTAGQLAVGKYKVWINNDIVPYASEQDFGTDGKMKNAPVPEVKDGIVNENGTLYYYVNGEKQVNLGLIEIEVDGVKRYIYVRTAGQLAVGDYKVWVNNDIVPYASLQKFDENGYMIVTE